MVLRQGKAGKFFQCKPCNVIEKLDADEKRGRKSRDANIKKYQQQAPLSSSLGDALRAALEEKK
jgi:DNA topoisomerase-3